MAAWMIPAAIGALGLGSKLFEKKPKIKTQQFPTMAPQQQGLQDQILQMLGGQAGQNGQGGMGGILDQLFGGQGGQGTGYDTFAQPYLNQFQQDIVPSIAERFSAVGGRNSSAFNQAMGRAGQDLAARLAQLRSQQQTGAIPSLLSAGFGSRFNTGYQQTGGPGPLAELMAPITQAYGSGLGMRAAMGMNPFGNVGQAQFGNMGYGGGGLGGSMGGMFL